MRHNSLLRFIGEEVQVRHMFYRNDWITVGTHTDYLRYNQEKQKRPYEI